MVGSRVLERVLSIAERDRARVVLVGDRKRLPEIDAGGAFRDLAERLDAHQLTENRRQQNGWEQDALTLPRDAGVQRRAFSAVKAAQRRSSSSKVL
jgi:ATP-dependent exoDNAse (exonuclease V) alpha subunit